MQLKVRLKENSPQNINFVGLFLRKDMANFAAGKHDIQHCVEGPQESGNERVWGNHAVHNALQPQQENVALRRLAVAFHTFKIMFGQLEGLLKGI